MGLDDGSLGQTFGHEMRVVEPWLAVPQELAAGGPDLPASRSQDCMTGRDILLHRASEVGVEIGFPAGYQA